LPPRAPLGVWVWRVLSNGESDVIGRGQWPAVRGFGPCVVVVGFCPRRVEVEYAWFRSRSALGFAAGVLRGMARFGPARGR